MRFNWKSDGPLLEKSVLPTTTTTKIHEKKLFFCLLIHLYKDVMTGSVSSFCSNEETSLSVNVSMLGIVEKRDGGI